MFHKSAKGRVVNFDELQHKNATTVAVGNANLNARGDVIGRGGQVVETAEARRAVSANITTTTTKASVQSEISALKAARNNWTPAGEPVADIAPVVEIREEETQPVEQEVAKKKRTITESE